MAQTRVHSVLLGAKVKKLTLIVMVTVIACLTGCVKSVEVHNSGRLAEDGSAENGSATVYVIRGDFGARALLSTNVEVDGVSQGWLRRETSMHFNVKPGHHELRATFPVLLEPSGGVGIGADFEKNKTYYFLWNGSDNVVRPVVNFGQVAPGRGKELVKIYPARG